MREWLEGRRALVVLGWMVTLGWSGTTAAASPNKGAEAAPVDAAGRSVAATVDSDAGGTMTVKDEPLGAVFRAIAAKLRQPVKVSAKAARYRLTGRFNLAEPVKLIEQLTGDMGLIWYYDGRAVFIYDDSELQSTMLVLSAGMFEELNDFLKRAALLDPHYPLRATADRRGVYVSGPPKYVETVASTARMLRMKEAESSTPLAQAGARRVELIKLRYASVAGRQFSTRGLQARYPGVAELLQAALGAAVTIAVPPGGVPAAETMGATTGATASAESAAPMPALAVHSPPPGSWILPPLPETRAAPSRAGEAVTPVRVVPYPEANALLIDGTEKQLAAARKLIAALDTPKRQIELSLWIIDIRRDDSAELGAKYGLHLNGGGMLDFSLDLGGASAALSKEQTKQFIAKIAAMSQDKQANVVSRPVLLTQDNMPAIFDHSNTYYVKVEGHRVNSLERVTYGTLLSVLPRVSSDPDQIEMTLDIEDGADQQEGRAQQDTIAAVSRTQISTVARVSHQQNLLIGGYTQERDRTSVSKVPWLGDVPYLGALFRYKHSAKVRSIRLFLIQPKVLGEETLFDPDAMGVTPEIDNAVQALQQKLENRHGPRSL